jgi:hypothetical protein
MTVPGLVVLLVLLAVAGCSAEDPSPQVRDCGIEEPGMVGETNVAGRTCLLEAFAEGTPAVFESRLTSVEGDPIIRRYLVVSASEVRIEHDARQDRYGSGTIEVLSCPRIVAVEEWNRVMNDEMRAAEVFVEDGCEMIGSR